MDRNTHHIESEFHRTTGWPTDNSEDVALSAEEGAALVRLFCHFGLQDAKRYASSQAEAVLMLLASDRLLAGLRQAGYGDK